jgi:hypothetical protein
VCKFSREGQDIRNLFSPYPHQQKWKNFSDMVHVHQLQELDMQNTLDIAV